MQKFRKIIISVILVLIVSISGLWWYFRMPRIEDVGIQTLSADAQNIPLINNDNRFHQYDERVVGLMTFVADLIYPSYFEKSSESPDFDTHLSAIEINIPRLDGVGLYEVSAHTLIGDVDPAIRVLHWAGSDQPALIYHHGANVIPFDQVIGSVFEENPGVTIIAVRAPFHQSTTEFVEASTRMDNYLALMATSVAITEELVQQLEGDNIYPIAVAGYSLGGFITNRHHLSYNTADLYVPFAAGTAHGEIFLSTYPADANTSSEQIRGLLNFDEEWSQSSHPNVYPVLMRYDVLNPLDVMAASYGQMPIEVWDLGHMTGIFAVDNLRQKMLEHLGSS